MSTTKTAPAVTDIAQSFTIACQNDLLCFAQNCLSEHDIKKVDVHAKAIEHDAVKIFGHLILADVQAIDKIPVTRTDQKQAAKITLQRLLLRCLQKSLANTDLGKRQPILPKIAAHILSTYGLGHEGAILLDAPINPRLPVLRNASNQNLADIVLTAARQMPGKLADDLYALYWRHQEPVFTAQQANEKILALLSVPDQGLAVTRFVVDAPHIQGKDLSATIKCDLTKNILCSNDPALWRAAAKKGIVVFALEKKQSALAFYAQQCQMTVAPIKWHGDMITAIIESATTIADQTRLAKVLRDDSVAAEQKVVLRKALLKLDIPLARPSVAERAAFTAKYPRQAAKQTATDIARLLLLARGGKGRSGRK